MFSIGQKVICVDASNQPALQEGKTYTIWALQDGRGIRVESDSGPIRHSFAVSRFEAVPSYGIQEAPGHVVYQEGAGVSPEDCLFNDDIGVLVVDGDAFKVTLEFNSTIGKWVLNTAKELTA